MEEKFVKQKTKKKENYLSRSLIFQIFLLAARKVAKLNRQSEYLITTDIATLSEKAGGDGCVGKLRANNIKNTEYTLYDNGKSPNKYKYKHYHSKHNLRRELGAIIYVSMKLDLSFI